jgi:hypothetical protein
MFILYYFFSITGRVCFHSYHFSKEWTLIILIDYSIDLFWFIDYLNEECANFLDEKPVQKIIRRLSSVRNIALLPVLPPPPTAITSTILLELEKKKQMSMKLDKLALCRELFLLFPFELIFYAAGFNNFGLFRLTKLLRLFSLHSYWSELTKSLERHKILKSSSAQRAAFYLMMMFCLGHIGGCIVYAISYAQITQEHPVLDIMLIQSKQAYINDEGKVIFAKPVFYRYLTALYWSVNVIVSTFVSMIHIL